VTFDNWTAGAAGSTVRAAIPVITAQPPIEGSMPARPVTRNRHGAGGIARALRRRESRAREGVPKRLPGGVRGVGVVAGLVLLIALNFWTS